MKPSLTSYRQTANRLTIDLARWRKQAALERAQLAKAKQTAANVKTAQELVQAIAKTIQQRAHEQIAGVVTRCLQSVFVDDPYRFEIEFRKSRGKTDARLKFFDGKGREIDPTDGAYGGALDVASFALRLSCMMLIKPQPRRLLVLDEPFKNVNGEANRQRAAELLVTIAKEMKIQIIMVTGYDWLHVGKIIKLK